MMRRAAILGLLVATCWLLSGCAPANRVDYPVSLTTAHGELRRMGLPPMVFGTEEPAFIVDAASPGEVRWSVRRDGSEVLRYTASLSALANGETRIVLAMTAPDHGPFGNVRERLAKNASIAEIYRVAMLEQIDATLRNRPFDGSKIYPAMMVALRDHRADLVTQLDRVAEQDRNRDRANIDKAYRDAGIKFPNRP